MSGARLSAFISGKRLPARAAALLIIAWVAIGPPVAAQRAVRPRASVEQTSQGSRPAGRIAAQFDGLGVGFEGPQGTVPLRNPSDNSLAVGPNHIVQIVNTRLAIFTKKGAMFDSTGRVLQGAVPTNSVFAGFGGSCELRNNGDAVVRYDQLADRWLFLMPIFSRPPGEPNGPYAMCYAISQGTDPAGPYFRYQFERPLFPDYPRPAIWPDGYYIPTSTSDDFIQKHLCIADRTKMLKGLPAAEQCMIVDGVNFLNNADIDGFALPPAGAPNIMMAAGAAQLHGTFEDDGIYYWNVHVDWENSANTGLAGPYKIPVAPYHYLCNGQLTSCVPQPDTSRRLDAQGDKIMQRLVYRNVNGHESIVAQHSVNTAAGGGGVRWYEFRLDAARVPRVFQQGTYAPDKFYRWMGSIGMDRQGNIAVGYSFGGTPNYPGQRFAGRMENDPPGVFGVHETVLVEGQASQKNTLRWEDYTTMTMDPTDDCTFWYVGDYIRTGAPSYSTRIAGVRLPDCRRGTVNGSAFLDLNHDGIRQGDEPGLRGWAIEYSGGTSGVVTTDGNGMFTTPLGADSLYGDPTYLFSAKSPAGRTWTRTLPRVSPIAGPSRGSMAIAGASYRVRLQDGDYVTGANFGFVCEAPNTGGASVEYWRSPAGRAVLAAHDALWRQLVDTTLFLVKPNGARWRVGGATSDPMTVLQEWLAAGATSGQGVSNASYNTSVQLAATAFSVAFAKQDGGASVHDFVSGKWMAVRALIERVSSVVSAHPMTEGPSNFRGDVDSYRVLLAGINANTVMVTPSTPARCKSRP